MKYNNILFIFPLIALLHIKVVTCDCKAENEGLKKIINCTGIPVRNVPVALNMLQLSDEESYNHSTVLIIKDSNIPTVHGALFGSLTSVEEIFLVNDNITDINSHSFRAMSELVELHITNNRKLFRILNYGFSYLDKLKILNLSHNNLTSLNNIENLISLEELNVTNNNILKLTEDSFEGMPRLKILNLSKNKLTTLEYINQIHTLEVLNVSFNLIASVTKYDFEKFVSLKSLDLSQNLLTSLSQDLFINSHNLTDLFLRNNSIKHFSNDLFYKSISHVDVSLNLMHTIQCEQIHGSIVLANNYIDTVCHFGENITWIDFTECDLPTVENQAFSHLHNLTFLNLTRNYIETVHVDAFENLYKLFYLSISDNEIAILEVGTFHQLASLEILDISKNLIEKLDHGIFTGLNKLTSLNLSHNKLKIVDHSIFYPVKNLEELYIENNPLITFDISSLTNNLDSLKSMSIHFDEIGCEALESKLSPLYSKSVTVKPGQHTKGHNINGIPCNPDILDDSRGRRNHRIIAEKFLNFFNTFRIIFFLITAAFIILITMHFVSWYSKNFNGCTKNNLKKSGSSCSVTLLTENGHD